jgi:hypothetical protein
MMIEINKVCPFCGGLTVLNVSKIGINKWANGELVQKAFPTMSATDREILISGICPKCQIGVFGSDDEEEEDISACERDSLDFMGQWW